MITGKEDQRFLFRAQTRAVLPHGAILHASSVELDGKAVVFLAPSGGGKSTIALNLAQTNFFLLADDTLILADGTDFVTRCLPCGSLKLTTGLTDFTPANLKALVFVEKGENPVITKISPQYACYRALRIESIIGVRDLDMVEVKQIRLYLKQIFSLFPTYIMRYSLRTDPSIFISKLLSEDNDDKR